MANNLQLSTLSTFAFRSWYQSTYLDSIQLIVILFLLSSGISTCRADLKFDDDGEGVAPKVDNDLGADKEGSRTDDGVVQREEEAIKLDGLNVAQIKELRDKAEKFQFQVSH